VNNNLTLQLSTGHHRDDYGLPGYLFWSALRSGAVDPRDSTNPNDTASTEDNFLDFIPELKFRDDVTFSLGGSYRDRHTASFYDYGSGSTYDLKTQLQTYGVTPKLVISTPLGTMKNTLVSGVDYYKYATTFGSYYVSFFGPSLSQGNIDRRDFAYYVDDKFYPVNDLVLEAGYRKQQSAYDVRGSDTTYRYDRDAYRFSANYTILDKANAFLTYAKGFRFPVTDEFISYGYYYGGTFYPTTVNTALTPQTTEELDAGIRLSPLPMLTGTVTYFRSFNRNEIFFNPLTVSNDNYDRTKRQGFESAVFVRLAEGLGLDVAYSYTEAFFDGGAFDGNHIPLVPQNKVSAKLTYALRNWRFGLASVYTGARYPISDQANTHEQLPGYTTFDGSVGYTYKKLSALFTVKNFTDKRYAEMGVASANDVALYPSPGRQFFLRIQYEFGK